MICTTCECGKCAMARILTWGLAGLILFWLVVVSVQTQRLEQEMLTRDLEIWEQLKWSAEQIKDIKVNR